jgi:hypothetical protein
MACRALQVPVLRRARPVQLVVVGDVLAGVEVEPALAAFGLRPRIPSDRERLHAPARELDQVLLQRVDAERVLDLVVGEPAVRTVGAHHERAVATEEARDNGSVRERRVVKIPEHGRVRRRLHRLLVVRTAPGLGFRRMARDARRAAHERRGRRGALRKAGTASGEQRREHERPDVAWTQWLASPLFIADTAWSMLNVAARWLGGNSLNVSRNCDAYAAAP